MLISNVFINTYKEADDGLLIFKYTCKGTKQYELTHHPIKAIQEQWGIEIIKIVTWYSSGVLKFTIDGFSSGSARDFPMSLSPLGIVKFYDWRAVLVKDSETRCVFKALKFFVVSWNERGSIKDFWVSIQYITELFYLDVNASFVWSFFIFMEKPWPL